MTWRGFWRERTCRSAFSEAQFFNNLLVIVYQSRRASTTTPRAVKLASRAASVASRYTT
jgi:hypothetical protein